MFAAAVCFYFFFRADQKMKKERIGKAMPIVPLAAKKKRFWLVALSVIVGSIVFILLAPYTVENFSPALYFYVVPADIVFVSLILFLFWKKLVGPATVPK